MKYFFTLLVIALTLTIRSDKALAQSQSISAGFRGTHGTDGNMFEIAAKDQPVLIERLDINMGEGTEPVEVYYRPGHVNYTYDDSYKLIFGGNITSAGKGLATPLPPFTSPVLVTPGTPVTFYVTIANRYGANLWYSIGVGSGTTYASDENIDIIEGYASGYPWTGQVAYDRQWNGVVHYTALAQSVSAGFRGTHGTDGNMFEIAAKDQPVLIERLDINMGEGTEPVEVYYRPGHVNYTYDDSYKLIFGGNITSAGKGLATPLPPFTSPVLVTPGTPVTFYVTIANRYGANLWYSIGVGSGTTYASDENIDIIEGYASLYPWTGQVAYDRQWNGVVHYSLLTNSSQTASPTKSPTAFPVTSPPSVGNPNPTASPVATQTGSPTIIELDVENSPTKNPTPMPTPTMSPTLLTSVPSLSPTVDDDDDFWPFRSSSASFNRFNYMGWMCTSSFPLLFITFFVL